MNDDNARSESTRQHVLFTPSNYPSLARPTASPFVRQVVRAVARAGARCTVIAPVRLSEMLRTGRRDDIIGYDQTADGNPIKLIRPRYISFSKKHLFGISTGRWTYLSFRSACLRGLRHLDQPADAVLGHFLYAGGAAAVYIGRRLGIPSFVRVGESGTWSVANLGSETVRRDFAGIAGMVANSPAIGRRLAAEFEMPLEKVLIEPNGVDLGLFHPRDRMQMRAKLGLPADRFLIAFVGHFDENKGPHRLMAAVDGMADIGLLFIGAGAFQLKDSRIVHIGRVTHAQVPEYLGAADLFVLPTLAEGSCNAVLEALACGLPVVSSDREFNSDLDDTGGAILVDPQDINALRQSILAVKTNGALRERMRRGALEKARHLDIAASARRLLEWMSALKPTLA